MNFSAVSPLCVSHKWWLASEHSFLTYLTCLQKTVVCFFAEQRIPCFYNPGLRYYGAQFQAWVGIIQLSAQMFKTCKHSSSPSQPALPTPCPARHLEIVWNISWNSSGRAYYQQRCPLQAHFLQLSRFLMIYLWPVLLVSAWPVLTEHWLGGNKAEISACNSSQSCVNLAPPELAGRNSQKVITMSRFFFTILFNKNEKVWTLW